MSSIIESERLTLVALGLPELEAMAAGRPVLPFAVPAWWPNGTDRPNLERWLDRARRSENAETGWGPRAIVVDGRMVGHCGFHGPPRPIEEALADPTYSGPVEPAAGGAVEIGYTVFPVERGNGYATEAAAALIGWAVASERASTVIAAVAGSNRASLAVVERLGGFAAIGTCLADGGVTEIVHRRDR